MATRKQLLSLSNVVIAALLVVVLAYFLKGSISHSWLAVSGIDTSGTVQSSTFHEPDSGSKSVASYRTYEVLIERPMATTVSVIGDGQDRDSKLPFYAAGTVVSVVTNSAATVAELGTRQSASQNLLFGGITLIIFGLAVRFHLLYRIRRLLLRLFRRLS